jgi:hypothetical protein
MKETHCWPNFSPPLIQEAAKQWTSWAGFHRLFLPCAWAGPLNKGPKGRRRSRQLQHLSLLARPSRLFAGEVTAGRGGSTSQPLARMHHHLSCHPSIRPSNRAECLLCPGTDFPEGGKRKRPQLRGTGDKVNSNLTSMAEEHAEQRGVAGKG